MEPRIRQRSRSPRGNRHIMRLDALTIAGLTGAGRSRGAGRGVGEGGGANSPVRSDATLSSIQDSCEGGGGSSILTDELGDIMFTDDEFERDDHDNGSISSPNVDVDKEAALNEAPTSWGRRVGSGEQEEGRDEGGTYGGKEAAPAAPALPSSAAPTQTPPPAVSSSSSTGPASRLQSTTATAGTATAVAAVRRECYDYSAVGASTANADSSVSKISSSLGRGVDALPSAESSIRPPSATPNAPSSTATVLPPPPAVERRNQRVGSSDSAGAILSAGAGRGVNTLAYPRQPDSRVADGAAVTSEALSRGSAASPAAAASTAVSCGDDIGGGVGPRAATVPTVTCKVLVVGNAKCGKTSIISRFVSDRFTVDYNSTVGADYKMKDVCLKDGRQVRLQLWDIAGQDRFAKLTRAYFRRAKGAVVVCDVTREGTFDAIVRWKEEIDLWCQNEGCELPVYLFANKCDLLTEVEDSFLAGARMEKTCRESGFTAWHITSAKRGDNIEQAMTKLLEDALEIEERRNRGAQGEEPSSNGNNLARDATGKAFRLSSGGLREAGQAAGQQACCA